MADMRTIDLLEGLNPPQREAVTYGEGPLLVLAGPGSGKTTVIVKRIQYLVARMHVPPEQILVITFTKDAARSMQQRYLQQAGKGLPVHFGTFHSVFYHILRQSSHFKNSSRITILTEAQKKNLIIPVLKKLKQGAGGNCYTPDNMASDAGEMLTAISYYKNTGDEIGAVGKLSGEWKAFFRDALAGYRQSAMGAGALDFDDMAYECRKVLERDAELRHFWQRSFSHILIDEFQDINPVQYQVVKLLTREPFNLFAVGDDDQAIYGFRGADPACLRQFEKEFKAKQVLLNINYRSYSEIVAAAGKVIEENNVRYRKELRAASERAEETEQPVKILRFQGREQQNAYLRAGISRFLKAFPERSCAVLFRTNIYMQSFGASLAKEGIGYSMRERARNIYEHFVAMDVMAYLQLAAGEKKRALFLRIMNKPSRFLRREPLADAENVDFDRLRQWYRTAEGGRKQACLEALEQFRSQLEAMERMPPYLAVQYVCRAVGYEKWLREQAGGADRERRQEWLEILDWLKEDAKGYGSVADWLEAQKDYAAAVERDGAGNVGITGNAGITGSAGITGNAGNAELTGNAGLTGNVRNAGSVGKIGNAELTGGDCPEKESGKNVVQLMTVHAAKGLEFDHVWIPDCNEKNFPHGSMLDKNATEEERRIFYVGMTRAKSSLELLWITGTKERPRLMSRFLNPIADQYSSSSPISSSNSQLSRYSSNASATFSYSSSSSM